MPSDVEYQKLYTPVETQLGSFSFKQLWDLGESGAVRKPHLPGRGIQNPPKNGELNAPKFV